MHHLVIPCLHIIHLIKQNKLDYYRGDYCMKKFCKDLREHTTKIINYEKKDDTINKKRRETP